MIKQKTVKQGNMVNKVTVTGTIVLLALLLLFMIVTLFTTNRLASQVQVITEHPFTVNGDISDAKTNLAMMRILTERLQSYNQPDDVDKVKSELEDLYSDMDVLLSEIDELYLGPDEDIDALLKTYKDIQEAHYNFLAFARLSSSTTDIIANYEEENLFSLYATFDDNASRILTFVRGTQQNIFTSAGELSKSTVIWSAIIFTATTAGLIFFQMIIRKMNHQLYQKSLQFEVLSNTIDETFLIFEKDKLQCDFISGSADKVLGLPAEQLRENRELVYQYMSEDKVRDIRRALESGTQTYWDTDVEYRNPANSEPRWLNMRFYRLDEDGNIKFIVTLMDRSHERQANQALQDALTSAQKANSAKKDFLSRMSHEIRTPMNAIVGLTTIAAASIEDRGRVESCLEKISYASKHLLMLINDVLDMSRIESNRMSISREPFELFQFLNGFVSVIYPQVSEKGLELTEKTSGFSEHTTFLGDSLRLNQILLNLASNAIKFTPSGGKISLNVISLPSRGNISWLRFVIADTGIGMDAHELTHLYAPFEQANETIAGKYGGTGLGMSITQNLVSLMGGFIKVESKPNQGTTFTVDLPFEKSDVDLHPISQGDLEALEVLVVDDEQDICEHTTLLLEKMNICAQWVLSGAEAVEKVIYAQETNHAFDVCFVDWKMPGMDGVETARRIRDAVGPDTPIIIISAYDWTDIEEEARAAGVNAFIAKPMFLSSIYNVLVNVTNGAFGITEEKVLSNNNTLYGKRLLLAEDNELNTEIAVTLLEMNGARMEYVNNGKKAVERFLQMEPGYYDAILMDVQMPVMDGCKATKAIRTCGRSDAKSIPIIATTANAFAEDVATVLEAGMDAHIGKPMDIQQLCAVLLQLWDKNDRSKEIS